MHVNSVSDFPLFCSNFAQKCLILPAECLTQKSLILLEILPAEFIQAYMWSLFASFRRPASYRQLRQISDIRFCQSVKAISKLRRSQFLIELGNFGFVYLSISSHYETRRSRNNINDW